MRALIFTLSALVVLLSVLILLGRPEPTHGGPVLDATRLIDDARAGEWATYRDESGETLTFRVDHAIPAGVDHPPRIRVHTFRRDRLGNPVPAGAEVYDHVPPRHGLFPLTAPADPQGLDRVWIWARIQRGRLTWQGVERGVWRVDLVDPALPEANGQDHVVAWLDETVPVFGLVRWQRWGRTWDLVDWRPR